MKNAINIISQQNFTTQLLDNLEHLIKLGLLTNIWYGFSLHRSAKVLWLYTTNKKQLKRFFTDKSLKTLEHQNQLDMIVLDTKDLDFQRDNGNYFSKLYLTEAHWIYCSDKVVFSSWCNEMDFDRFKDSYTQKQKLLATYGNEFVAQQAIGSWGFYIKSFQNDCDYLELLVFGITHSKQTLSKRLLRLEKHIPEVKRLFVKENAAEYYLIKDVLNENDGGFNMDWHNALLCIQKRFKRLVHAQMHAVWAKAHQQKLPKSKIPQHPIWNCKNATRHLNQLCQLPEVEEVYLFGQNLQITNQNPTTHYYLLAITTVDTPEKQHYFQGLFSNSNSSSSFTIIQHSRIWIQRYAYEYQGFLKNVLRCKNRIYQSDWHPPLHWYSNYEPFYDDLWQEIKQLHAFYKKKLRKQLQSPVAQQSFSTKILHHYLSRSLQLYLYAKSYYKPTTSHLHTLWNLCLYISPEFYAVDTQLKSFPLNLLDNLEGTYQTPKTQLILDVSTTKKMSELFSLIQQ
ncbi:hypothetical protein [Flavobacterium sp. NKUCC04_CG]|uniref:hypothetical protein n=1 Tax=Flavobacterium sp. NKUCC04_CG TaxID=2842121 RepID=UPI001C5B24D2|nr:hypothetical protein [Flavobacterium sp. NKUCC04_CG]MBW3519979.1 hypothetical protein [Flavobacterium sp. NKUCC04_CG]